MSGRLLIVDSVVTNRIVLKVKLLAAKYAVTACATRDEALGHLANDRPDLVVLSLADGPEGVLAFCRALRKDPATTGTAVICLADDGAEGLGVAALRAGADDVMVRPVDDALMLARIRSLLRARNTDAEFRLRGETARVLGLAEPPGDFARPGRVVLVAEEVTQRHDMARRVAEALGQQVIGLAPDRALAPRAMSEAPDVFIILARSGTGAAATFRLVADLRSRSDTRHAAQLVICPRDAPELAAMALDLGVNDVATDGTEMDEIALRISSLLRRKARADQLRASVQSGLRAAVTDPLTGLYNRRYAIPHLASLADRARAEGRGIALMVLDIDHFKAINDTWGHAIGDAVLVGVARRLRDALRAVDLVARIGGEEFLVAMPNTSVEQARAAAERLRITIEGQPFATLQGQPPVEVTLSIGVAMEGNDHPITEDIEGLIARADRALYDAKAAGRNMVTMSLSAA
ncbi:MAG: diguanylate cyclase [Limimaricola sp.]|uniref:diguanylate cyclase n=1 Tax=Limimaricola sp. TaxID=2211665 RepID=UPI001DAE3FA3|nr:diguanylate cyclase [Limimaricola sp.]MBI1416275.1 diguanylate cyclase [Limimaricola sp.]